jgi:hypothetical protein
LGVSFGARRAQVPLQFCNGLNAAIG